MAEKVTITLPDVYTYSYEDAQNTQFYTFLEQLDVPIQRNGNGQSTLSTEDLSETEQTLFEFYRRFARMTKVEDNLLQGNNPAYDVLEVSEQYNPFELSYNEPEPKTKDTLLPYLREQEQRRESWVHFDPATSQEEQDQILDNNEADLLTQVLMELDDKPQQGQHWTLQNPELVKAKIAELVKSDCWLEPQNLRLGLFADRHGDDDYFAWGNDLITNRYITPPRPFICEYLPLVNDPADPEAIPLFYTLDNMPKGVQQATQSVVEISIDIGAARWSGIGCSVLHPNYILTAKHIFEEIIGTEHTFSATISSIDGKSQRVNIEFLELPGQPDMLLIALRHSEPPTKVEETFEPIPFALPEIPEKKKGSKSKISPPMSPKKRIKQTAPEPTTVFALGKAFIPSPTLMPMGADDPDIAFLSALIFGGEQNRQEFLFTSGVVMAFDKVSRVMVGTDVSTALANPGFSGGPLIQQRPKKTDSEEEPPTELYGINVAFYPPGNYEATQDNSIKITGTEFYLIEEWADIIRGMIEDDLERQAK